MRAPAPSGQTTAGSVPTATGAGSAAATVTRKPTDALPPEFVAVTVTASAVRSASVGSVTRPVPASMRAPPPATAKTRPAPAKAAAAATSAGPEPCTSSRSSRPPAATGAARRIASRGVSAATLPAAFVAVTRADSPVASSASPGR